MWTLLIIVSVICIGFFVWSGIDYKRRKEKNNKAFKPPFRSEQDVQEYAKPMKGDDQSSVDLDDA